MRIIDFHTHIYPDALAQKATQSICSFYHLQTDLIGTAQTLLEENRKAGITQSVLLPVAIKPEHAHHINDFAAEQAQAHAEFIGFGALHAGMDDPLAELSHIRALGLQGIKLHPDAQGFPIDDERLFPVYDALGDTLPVVFHCGDPQSDLSHPRRLKRVLTRFPHLRVIAAHMGGWSLFDTAFDYLHDETCYLDISSSMMLLDRDRLARLIRSYGADRVVFGSDFPLWVPEREVQSFLALPLTAAERDKIAYQNAREILRLPR